MWLTFTDYRVRPNPAVNYSCSFRQSCDLWHIVFRCKQNCSTLNSKSVSEINRLNLRRDYRMFLREKLKINFVFVCFSRKIYFRIVFVTTQKIWFFCFYQLFSIYVFQYHIVTVNRSSIFCDGWTCPRDYWIISKNFFYRLLSPTQS